ncbi:MAG: tetratricopeptide repeat protein [Planctomycetota bacterium]
MSQSARRRRRNIRLGIVGAVVLLLVGGVSIRVLTMGGGSDPRLTDPRRVAGLAAFEAGDTQEILAQLGPYLEQFPYGDPEARFAFSKTQLEQAEGDPVREIEAAMGLRLVLRDQPDFLPAARLLLPILTEYPRGVEEEGLRLAKQLLQDDREDPAALKANAVLLPRTGRDSEALPAIIKYLDKQPNDISAHRLAFAVMKRMNKTNRALLDHAASYQASEQVDETTAQLIQANALLLTEDRAAAVQTLRDLASSPPADQAFAKQQVLVMDEAAMFAESLAYLESLYAKQHPALPLDELIRRRFEAGRGVEALTLIDSLTDPSSIQRIIKTLVLAGRGDAEAASAVAEGFAAEQTQASKAIAAVLTAAIRANRDGLEPVMDAGRGLRDAGVANPYLELIVAEAFDRSGQPERAIPRYQSALQMRPSWASPCLGLAELYLSQNNPTEAMNFAAAAVQRQPRSVAGRIALAEALGADPQRLNGEQRQEILNMIDLVQAAQPGEPRTLALRIAVLAGSGDTETATAALFRALNADPPPSQTAMVTLIEAAKRYNLDPEGKTQAAYVDRFGQTVAITMVQAQRLIDAGRADEALRFFDESQPAAPGAEWAVNRALLLEKVGRPEAVAAWSAVGDNYPNDLRIQQAILTSSVAWQDRSSIDDTIKRLRKLTGEEDAGWMIERARWLLTSADPIAAAEEADGYLDTALNIEPDSAQALALRGRSQRLLGNPRLAVSLLKQAVTLNPTNANTQVELALAQRDTGADKVALETAQRAALLSEATPDAQRRAAQVMIDGKRFRDAADILANLVASDTAQTQDVFTLTQLYRQTKQDGRALALTDKLLANPTPETVAVAADLLAQASRTDEAEAALSKLDALEVEASEKLRIRAAHAAAYGSSEAADEAWVAAVQAAPQNPDVWLQLIGLRLRNNRTIEAIASAQAAAAKFPDHKGFNYFANEGVLISRMADEPGAAALGISLLEEDKHQTAAIEALRVLDRARTGQLSTEDLTDRLVEMAEATPDFESLWLLSVSKEFDAGRIDSATARADEARERFPESVRSARLATEAYSVAGRWEDVLPAAEAWRLLTTGSTWEADALAARAHREIGRPEAAAGLLLPYTSAVNAQPEAMPMLTKELALSLASTGRANEARKLLEPLLPDGTRWRMAWIDVVILGVPSWRQASRWLETLEKVMPQDAPTERATLAQAWWTIGMRNDNAALRQRGREMAAALAQTQITEDAGLWFFVGTAAEIDGDFAEAESSYRRALALNSREPGASNNLAMILADHGGDLAEAELLARTAIEVSPNEANYFDTLAHVLRRRGRLDEAREAIQKAIDIDPGNPAWQDRLNEMVLAQ